MRAVVSKGAYAIEVEDRPKPQIIEPEDVIIEVCLVGSRNSVIY